MKRIPTLPMLLLACALLPAGPIRAQDPYGTVSYALPQTTIRLEVEAVCEHFFAGPYAKFAEKYLGVQARQQDQTTCTLDDVKMTPYIEADPSARFFIDPEKTAYLSLSSQGLIAVSDGSFGETSQWRFPSPRAADFSERGISSNLTSEATTLFRGVQNDAAYNRVAVQQNMVVEKPLEQRAREAADVIFELRRKRMQIVIGDTDATYSGEAMGAALAEIAALEKEYMSLFVGYIELQPQKVTCDVVPVKGQKNQTYVAFRISDADGIVAADNLSGKPYLLEILPQDIAPAAGKGRSAKGDVALYRIPAVCTVKLTDGVRPILQSRIPVYQLGTENYFPLGK
jgi:hypothetical protein